MDNTNTKSKRVQPFYLVLPLLIISIMFFLALVIWVECFLRAFALDHSIATSISTVSTVSAPALSTLGVRVPKIQRLKAVRVWRESCLLVQLEIVHD
jgi:hypothetical protein